MDLSPSISYLRRFLDFIDIILKYSILHFKYTRLLLIIRTWVCTIEAVQDIFLNKCRTNEEINQK